MIKGLSFKPKEEAAFDKIQDGEIVDCMIISEGYDTAYLKDLDKKNAEKKSKNDSLGLPFSPELPSVKWGGLSLDYAVMRRKRVGSSTFEETFTKGDEYVEPSYVCYGRINQLTPHEIYFKQVYGMTFCAGDNADKLELVQIFPSVYPAAIWKNKVKLFDATNIPALYEGTEDAAKCERLEQERTELWAKEISNWNQKTEDECYGILCELLARRYLICQKEGDTLNYLRPKVGTMFRAQVQRYKQDKKYLDIRAYSNKGNVLLEHYSDFNSKWSEEYKSVAEGIFKFKQDNIQKRQEQTGTEEVPEKVPF